MINIIIGEDSLWNTTYCLFCCNSQEQVLQVGKSVHFRSFELLAVGSEGY